MAKTPEEKKAYKRQWYLDNKERHLAKCQEWVENNREKSRGYKAKWRVENRDKINEHSKNMYHENIEEERERNKKYKKNNPGKVKSWAAKRRAAELERTVGWSDDLVIQMIYEDCPEGYHVDHIIPLQGKNVSGLHVAWNLQYLTAEENLSKGNKYE